MPIQNFTMYTKNGYAGDLVDSGPRTVQTGILQPNATGANQAGFGVAVMRQKTGTVIPNGIELGGAENVFAITQREANHEALSRPAKAGDWAYLEGQSVSLIRQGYLRIKVEGGTSIKAGEVLHVDTKTGKFSKDAVAGDIVACTNVTADQDGNPGEIIKVRMDIVHV